MLELLKKRKEELELELKSQEITPADEEEINKKVAEYKQRLRDELISDKAEKTKVVSAKLEEVKNLIAEFEALPVKEEVKSDDAEEVRVEEPLAEETAQEVVDEERQIVVGY